jgi:hypothetical protein
MLICKCNQNNSKHIKGDLTMKDLNKLLKEVLADFDALGIQYGKIVEIVPNTRAKSRWGQCKSRYGGFYININASLLADDIDDRGARDTIAHEVCHTVKGCMNHGETWKKYAKMLNARGYNVKRTSSASEKGVDRTQYVSTKKYKYQIKCEKCGHLYNYSRKGKVVELISTHKNHGCTCAICGSAKLTLTTL